MSGTVIVFCTLLFDGLVKNPIYVVVGLNWILNIHPDCSSISSIDGSIKDVAMIGKPTE